MISEQFVVNNYMIKNQDNLIVDTQKSIYVGAFEIKHKQSWVSKYQSLYSHMK